MTPMIYSTFAFFSFLLYRPKSPKSLSISEFEATLSWSKIQRNKVHDSWTVTRRERALLVVVGMQWEQTRVVLPSKRSQETGRNRDGNKRSEGYFSFANIWKQVSKSNSILFSTERMAFFLWLWHSWVVVLKEEGTEDLETWRTELCLSLLLTPHINKPDTNKDNTISLRWPV